MDASLRACARCGLADNAADSRFCRRCGQPLDAAAPVARPLEPPRPSSARTILLIFAALGCAGLLAVGLAIGGVFFVARQQVERAREERIRVEREREAKEREYLEAQRRAEEDDTAYEKAGASKTSLEEYLRAHPAGNHVAEARERLEKIRLAAEEVVAFGKVAAGADAEARAYLERYPLDRALEDRVATGIETDPAQPKRLVERGDRAKAALAFLARHAKEPSATLAQDVIATLLLADDATKGLGELIREARKTTPSTLVVSIDAPAEREVYAQHAQAWVERGFGALGIAVRVVGPETKAPLRVAIALSKGTKAFETVVPTQVLQLDVSADPGPWSQSWTRETPDQIRTLGGIVTPGDVDQATADLIDALPLFPW